MNRQDKDVILHKLREIEYIWVGRDIRRWFFGEIIGWNVAASSVMRKAFTIERLQNIIKEENLPLEIKDTHEYLNSFKVYLKDAA